VTLIVLLIIVGNIGHHQRPCMLNLQHTCLYRLIWSWEVKAWSHQMAAILWLWLSLS